jgi:hypothetical protein
VLHQAPWLHQLQITCFKLYIIDPKRSKPTPNENRLLNQVSGFGSDRTPLFPLGQVYRPDRDAMRHYSRPDRGVSVNLGGPAVPMPAAAGDGFLAFFA